MSTATKKFIAFICVLIAGVVVFSNSISAQSAGKIYYVSPTGSDSNVGTSSAPFKSINFAAAKLLPGDTLILKDGVYAEAIDDTIPAGESWSKPITVKAENPRRAILRPPAGSKYSVVRIAVHKDLSGLSESQNEAKRKQYIVIEGLVMDAINLEGNGIHIAGSPEATGIRNPRFIRIVNNEIMHSAGKAVFTTYKSYGMGILNARGDDVEILRNDIHDNGLTDFDHGIYNYARRTLIEGNKTYHNRGTGIKGCWGSAPSEDIVIRGNTSYDNNTAQDVKYEYGEKGQGRGISCHYAKNVKVYNNIVWGAHVSGIDIIYDVTGGQVYNNTVYVTGNKFSSMGISVGGGSAGADPVTGVVIKNNIVVVASTQPPSVYNLPIFAGANNYQTIIQNNLTFGTNTKIDYKTNAPTIIDNFINVDPKFVDLAGKDFRLTQDSPAIDKGDALTSVLTTDFAGGQRPAGTKYDLGAYEFGATLSTSSSSTTSSSPINCPTDINKDGITDLDDYSALVSDFNKPYNSRSDFNKDNSVDISDYAQLVSQFLKLCTK